MSRRRVAIGVIVLTVVAATIAAGVVVAQDAGSEGNEGGGESEGGDELLDVSGVAAVVALLLGTAILMVSVEVLIHALVQTAIRFRVSAFVLAVVFSGFEFDNVAFGVFTGFRELQDVAFGLAIGNAVSIFGFTLALGALFFPFEIEVPREYLVLLVTVPLVLVAPLLTGRFTPTNGVLLLFIAIAVFAYVLKRESEADRSFMQSEEVMEIVTVADGEEPPSTQTRLPAPLYRLTRYDSFWPLVMVLAIGGIVIGAEGSAAGVEGVLSTWEMTGTVVGLTLVTLLYTIDDLLLIIEPLRLGYYDVAVGGVIGSLLFFVTANVGIVSLVGTVEVSPATLYFHFPVLMGMTALSAYFLHRGRMTRWHGALLLGLYIAYILVTLQFLGVAPVGE
jgi:cation:H+ antiporter